MKVNPTVLVVPGYMNSRPDHWQSLWERQHHYVRVQQRDWEHPLCVDWVNVLEEEVQAASAPVVFLAHSLGCIAVVHWAALHQGRVAGALLVPPADTEAVGFPGDVVGFGPVPLQRLPFRSTVVASTDNPYLTPERAELFVRSWGSKLVFLSGGKAHERRRWFRTMAIRRRAISRTGRRRVIYLDPDDVSSYC